MLVVVGHDEWKGQVTRFYICSTEMIDQLPDGWKELPEIKPYMTSLIGTGVDPSGWEFEVEPPQIYHRRHSDDDDLINQPYQMTFIVSRCDRR